MAGKAGPTRPWQGEGRMLKGLRTVAVMVALALPGLAAAQEDWPTRPITVIIPFPAGGQADIVTRVVTEKMAPILGQPILVEAKPGAAGNIGTAEVVKAAPDGYTWLSSGVPLTTAPAMYPTSLGFDPLKDLAPVMRFGDTSFVLAVPAELPVSSVAELVDYAKAHEGELSYAGSGIGSLVHLVSELFKLDAERSEVMPDVPTIGEAGYPGLVANGWAGFNVPAGTPEAVIEKINAAVSQVISDPAVVAQVEKVGWQIVPPQTPAEFGTFLADEARRWGEVVAKAEVETN
jgi:tripartite-type tricarboxylate transporter receptor subunit TctC